MNHTNNLGADDNAVVLVEYESGAMGILETGFLSKGSPFQLELYGTEGTILIEDNKIRQTFGNGEWSTPDNPPEALPMPMEQWASAIINGTALSINKSDVINLTLVNEIAMKSNKEGCWINPS